MSKVVDQTARFVDVVAGLLARAQDSVARAAVDQVAAGELCDLLETVSNLVHDHAHPKPKNYAEMLNCGENN